MSLWLGFDEDKLDVFVVTEYYKDFSYHNNVDNCWWLVPRRSMDNGLRALRIDKDLLDLC